MPPSKFPHNELQTVVISSNDPLHVELAKIKVPRSLPSIQGLAMISVGRGIPLGRLDRRFPAADASRDEANAGTLAAISDRDSDRRYVVPLDWNL
jgi:hypothetical protein